MSHIIQTGHSSFSGWFVTRISCSFTRLCWWWNSGSVRRERISCGCRLLCLNHLSFTCLDWHRFLRQFMHTPFSMAYLSLSHLQDLITMHLFLASICQRQIGSKYKNKIINGCFILNIHHHSCYIPFFSLSPCNYNFTSSLILLLVWILLNWFSDIRQQSGYIIILFTLIVWFFFSHVFGTQTRLW